MECLIEESAPAFKSKRLDILAQLVLQALMLQVKNATFASIPGLLGIRRTKFASLAELKEDIPARPPYLYNYVSFLKVFK